MEDRSRANISTWHRSNKRSNPAGKRWNWKMWRSAIEEDKQKLTQTEEQPEVATSSASSQSPLSIRFSVHPALRSNRLEIHPLLPSPVTSTDHHHHHYHESTAAGNKGASAMMTSEGGVYSMATDVTHVTSARDISVVVRRGSSAGDERLRAVESDQSEGDEVVAAEGNEPRGQRNQSAADARNRTKPSGKRKMTRKGARRFAKQTRKTVWRGVRFGAKILYNGFIMLASTTNYHFNLSDGAAQAWKTWTSNPEERDGQQSRDGKTRPR